MKPSTNHTVPDTALPVPARTAMGQSHFHESARAQVAGAAHYIDDLPEVKGTLYAAPILSTVAHGRLNGVDARAALALSGVRGVVLAADADCAARAAAACASVRWCATPIWRRISASEKTMRCSPAPC